MVFWISAIIYLVGAIAYGLLGSGEVEFWAYNCSKDNEFSCGQKNDNIDEVDHLKISNTAGCTNKSYDAIEK